MEIARKALVDLAEKLRLTEDCTEITMNVVNEFQRVNKEWSEDDIPDIVTCAALVATKAINHEVSNNNNGGSQIAVTKFFSGHSSEQVNSLLYWLKAIISDIKIDKEVADSCKQFVSTFGFINSFYDKYTSIWNSLEFKCISDS
jgi:hypothetical protein